MITNPASHSKNGKENPSVLHKATEVKEQRGTMFSSRLLLRWFGILSTLLIGLASIAPDAFGIPSHLRPWVFVVSIFWFLAVCAGIFN